MEREPRPPGSGRVEIEQILLERLQQAFRKSGWRVGRGASGSVDLHAQRGKLGYVIEVKAARESRRPFLQGLFADALLQARAHALKLRKRPLVVVGAEAVSEELARGLRKYAAAFFGGDAYGIMDGRGRMELHGEGLDGIQSPGGMSAAPLPPRPAPSHDIFSDRGQWMLKVLLAARVPEKYLAAPRGVLRHASDLAASSGVSLPSASRLLIQLEEQGFVERASGVLALGRVSDLLAEWGRRAGRPRYEIRARWILPAKEPEAQLGDAMRAHAAGMGRSKAPLSRACLGLFAAARLLGLGFVAGAPAHLYVEQLSPSALEAMGLREARRDEPVDLFLQVPRSPESVFRGVVRVDGVMVADAIQCWLDLSHHPARGAEQAAEIWRRVLAPAAEEK